MRSSSILVVLVVVLGCGAEPKGSSSSGDAPGEGNGRNVVAGETPVAGSSAPAVMNDDQVDDEQLGEAGSSASDPEPEAGAGGSAGTSSAGSGGSSSPHAGSGGSAGTSSAGSGGTGGTGGTGGSGGTTAAGTGGSSGSGGMGGTTEPPEPVDTACKVQGWNTYRCSQRQYFPDYTMTWGDGADTFTCDSVAPTACTPGAACKVFRPSSPGDAMVGKCL